MIKLEQNLGSMRWLLKKARSIRTIKVLTTKRKRAILFVRNNAAQSRFKRAGPNKKELGSYVVARMVLFSTLG